MFIERLLNDGHAPMLEEVVRFTGERHKLLADNIANADTPGYRQRDLSVSWFQEKLRERIEGKQSGSMRPPIKETSSGILFHDGNNRSMEGLQSELAKNALMHNLAVELLRKQYQGMEMALKERVV